MDPSNDIREFLVSLRAKLSPKQAHLPAFGPNGPVNGLAREVLVILAGSSAEY